MWCLSRSGAITYINTIFFVCLRKNHVMNLSKYPLLKILPPYISGIFLSYFGNFSDKIVPFSLVAIAVLWLLMLLMLRLKRYKWQWIKTAAMALAFNFAGVCTTTLQLSPRVPPRQRTAALESHEFLVRIVDFPVPRAHSNKVVVELLQTANGTPLKEKALLYVQRDTTTPLHYGDVLAISTTLSEFAPPANPDAFDMRRYMQRRRIFLTGYVSNSGWQIADNVCPNMLKAFSHTLQQRLAACYASAGMTGRELDIVRAILLGDDDTMEPELRAAYASAGVSHILCVSGMHVGVIFMILNFLLKPLDLFPKTRIAKAFLLMLSIWLYACITGLSPSVTRSATMFTFVTIGGVLRRNTNIFHSLMASLFILLSIKPLLLFEVGFQLSYLAVFGIVLIQPRIASLLTCKTRVGNYFWELFSVSVAAQIATFPISAHYFGTFPNYFMLSNLTAIILSFAVMVTGVGLLALSFVPYISDGIAFLLTWQIRIMNGIVTFVEGLPGAVTRDIDLSGGQVLLLYVVIAMVYCAICYRKHIYGWVALSALTLLSGTFALRRMAIERRMEMVAYNIRKVSALEFCYGDECFLFSDSIRDAESSYYTYSVQNHARKLHANWTFIPVDTPRYDAPFLIKRGPFIQFGDKCYYLLKRKEKVLPVECRPRIDMLLLQHNPTMLPEEVAKALDFAAVTADETNTPFYKERWRTYCEAHGIRFIKSNN